MTTASPRNANFSRLIVTKPSFYMYNFHILVLILLSRYTITVFYDLWVTGFFLEERLKIADIPFGVYL